VPLPLPTSCMRSLASPSTTLSLLPRASCKQQRDNSSAGVQGGGGGRLLLLRLALAACQATVRQWLQGCWCRQWRGCRGGSWPWWCGAC
jgi:hypothetical protein